MLRKSKKDKRYQSPSHRRAPKQEAEAAQRFGGRVVDGSGSAAMKRGDVRKRGVHRVECKCTKHKSFSVTREMVDKMEKSVFGTTEIAFMEIEFLNEGGSCDNRVYILTRDAMDHLMELNSDADQPV